MLLVVLIVTPRGKLMAPARSERRPPVPYHTSTKFRAVAGVIVVAALCFVPQVVGTKLSFWTVGLAQAVLLLSLGLLIRTAGLVSLCQAAFAAIGAVAFAQYVANFDLPWIVALILGAATVVPIAALLAIPAIRLSGLFLALATFGFGLMVERMFFSRDFMFTPLGSGRGMPRPSFGESDKAYYYVVLVCVVAVSLLIVAIHQGRLGRMLRGLSESTVAVNLLGLNVNLTRLIVFCISGFLAGLSGILYGGSVEVVTFGDIRFSSYQSLVLVAVLAVAPFREPWYAVFAAVTSVIPAYWDSLDARDWLNVVFGFFAVVVAMQGGIQPLPLSIQRLLDKIGGKHRGAISHVSATPVEASARPVLPSGPSGLEVARLTVRYGGHIALNSVDLSAPVGRITGLIGPNGAGKTTMFNTCSGLIRPASGTVRLHGTDVSALGAAKRGQLGLGRTFQVMQLCESLTVAENVSLGVEAGLADSSVRGQVIARPTEWRKTVQATRESMELCGIGELAEVPAGALSTGQRRLVELARCLAGPFDLLLLDEPSSGLDPGETRAFAQTLESVVREQGCGILLVEHDMSLVLAICEQIHVLDFGQMLFVGTPQEVTSSDVVRSAYLGTEPIDEVSVP